MQKLSAYYLYNSSLCTFWKYTKSRFANNEWFDVNGIKMEAKEEEEEEEEEEQQQQQQQQQRQQHMWEMYKILESIK